MVQSVPLSYISITRMNPWPRPVLVPSPVLALTFSTSEGCMSYCAHATLVQPPQSWPCCWQHSRATRLKPAAVRFECVSTYTLTSTGFIVIVGSSAKSVLRTSTSGIPGWPAYCVTQSHNVQHDNIAVPLDDGRNVTHALLFLQYHMAYTSL